MSKEPLMEVWDKQIAPADASCVECGVNTVIMATLTYITAYKKNHHQGPYFYCKQHVHNNPFDKNQEPFKM